ncbi:MAG: PhnA protein [Flaviaesturariibacter sp.]|nr:PhnA protein [Flaviaesturariibacter sp.]
MKLEEIIAERSGQACELCRARVDLQLFDVGPQSKQSADNTILLCGKCRAQIEKREEPDSAHWKVLAETMWSEVPGVQVMAWRMLNRLRQESWAADSLDLLYLDDDTLAWAKATGDHEGDAGVVLHRDAYGVVLQAGDTVVLTKSLDVKGTSFSARLGTVVRHIRLVPDNTDQIEGKIEGQQIVILTRYVRRQA